MFALVWQKCVFFNVFSVNYGKMYFVFSFCYDDCSFLSLFSKKDVKI